ncbi:MAG: hypothetical protein AB8C13_05415 [Phycisphaerales bacterium]
MSPEDKQVSGYLAEHGFDELLEIQLFDRLGGGADSNERLAVARQLAGMYLAELGKKDTPDSARQSILLKGEVLIGLFPEDALLDLRLELLVERFQLYEHAPDLDRIGLLDEQKRIEAAVELDTLNKAFKRLSQLSGVEVTQLNRAASRTSGEDLVEAERELSKARSVRSRSNFFAGWSGYGGAVLNRRTVDLETLKAFGSVLGFDGSIPVLDRMDMDLLEYDHVARSMLGVALCKLSDQEYLQAGLWLSAIEGSTVAPDFVIGYAKQRMLEVALGERDWLKSERVAIELRDAEPETLLGVAQSRLLVLKALGPYTGNVSAKGGAEGAAEIAKIGLDQLIELGEIGHILELRERLGTLPILDDGFVSYYTQGLSALTSADQGEAGGGYSQAAVYLGMAIEASDIEQYGIHAGDAVLKLAYAELRSSRPGAAIEVLETHTERLTNEDQREESDWLSILATDEAIQRGQDHLNDQFTELLERYIRSYPKSERVNILTARYALSSHLDPEIAVGVLLIDDPEDSFAIPARRKLMQLIYKYPELSPEQSGSLFGVLREHAEWIWEHQGDAIESVREARDRLVICRIILDVGLKSDSQSNPQTDTQFLSRVLERAQDILESEGAGSDYVQFESELAFRRVQILLLDGRVLDAGEVVLNSGKLDDSVRLPALYLVFEQSRKIFESSRSVPNAQAVILYGRAVLQEYDSTSDGKLDRKHSLIAEALADASEYVSIQMNDAQMERYASALSVRVFESGVPSRDGLWRTAILSERFNEVEIALECWMTLVQKLNPRNERWHQARFESLRLLTGLDSERAGSVYMQYRALYPEGSPEPWGERIRQLFSEVPSGKPFDQGEP